MSEITPVPDGGAAATAAHRAAATNLLRVSFAAMASAHLTVRAIEHSELSLGQFRMLALLRDREGASVSDVATHTGLSRPAVSRLVDGLVSRDLVDRRTVGSDRRRVSLTLSVAGRGLLEQVDDAVLTHLAGRLATLNGDEIAAITAVTRILGRVLQPDPDMPGPPWLRQPADSAES